MVYHNELLGNNIPLSILLQAVQHSTLVPISQDANKLYDFGDLREHCGCLVMVRQEKNPAKSQRSTVTFAHYTVKEYLQSSRILHTKVGFFALSQETIKKQFAEIAFRHALSIPPDTLPQCATSGYLHKLLDEDFESYCGLSSMLQIEFWPEAMSLDSTLMDLSEEFVNPHTPVFGNLRNLHSIMRDEKDSFLTDEMYIANAFYEVSWIQLSDPKPAVFLSFLLNINFDKTPHLALAFAERHSMLPILTQQLNLEIDLQDTYYEPGYRLFHFEGSIPEIFAQWSHEQRGVFKCILDLISELEVTHFDLSTLLLLYVGHHNTCCLPNSCLLKRLLHLGANVNGPRGAFVTPLQIAVSCWDFKGVEILLNAGADPNALGENGSGWARGSIMEKFNHLHKASSLHIIKHIQCIYRGETDNCIDSDEISRENIEARLLEVEAVEIAPSGLEPESNDVLNQPPPSPTLLALPLLPYHYNSASTPPIHLTPFRAFCAYTRQPDPTRQTIHDG